MNKETKKLIREYTDKGYEFLSYDIKPIFIKISLFKKKFIGYQHVVWFETSRNNGIIVKERYTNSVYLR